MSRIENFSGGCLSRFLQEDQVIAVEYWKLAEKYANKTGIDSVVMPLCYGSIAFLGCVKDVPLYVIQGTLSLAYAMVKLNPKEMWIAFETITISPFYATTLTVSFVALIPLGIVFSNHVYRPITFVKVPLTSTSEALHPPILPPPPPPLAFPPEFTSKRPLASVTDSKTDRFKQKNEVPKTTVAVFDQDEIAQKALLSKQRRQENPPQYSPQTQRKNEKAIQEKNNPTLLNQIVNTGKDVDRSAFLQSSPRSERLKSAVVIGSPAKGSAYSTLYKKISSMRKDISPPNQKIDDFDSDFSDTEDQDESKVSRRLDFDKNDRKTNDTNVKED